MQMQPALYWGLCQTESPLQLAMITYLVEDLTVDVNTRFRHMVRVHVFDRVAMFLHLEHVHT